MANEMIVWSGDPDGEHYSVYMFFPIDGAIGPTKASVAGGGADVVETPSGSLPADVLTRLNGLEPTWAADLDAGDRAFIVARQHKPEGFSNPELIAELQTRYASELAAFTASYTARHFHLGTSVSAS